ncbi:M23 family metallopeptidase [Caulobacter flavus]|uniref:M23 family metallopeptidase n=1 Tax=Caulobacter flavus TaxID=1679497 RepID=UPI0013DE0D5C|nr:M23 family metallopeptidase [Caulobacter flavus]
MSLRDSEDLAMAIERLGASSAEAAEAAGLVEQALGRPSSIVVSFSGAGALRQLSGLDATAVDGATAHVRRVQDGFRLTRVDAPRGWAARVVRGQMDERDFFSSAVARGLNDILVPVFTKALSYDLDFAREVAPSDLFEAVIEERRDSSGVVVGEPRLLYAGFHHVPRAFARVSEADGVRSDRAKSAELYSWGQASDGEPRWFDANGGPARRSLMRTPIEGGHITSVFGLRLHPVLGFFRSHKGIDFGAPKNTPVFAAADGQVEFAGPHGGHGNYLRVRHGPSLSTAYAHLDRFVEGLRPGDPVRQGQQIAWSGNSGISTGPHLHYEVIVDGEQVDPLSYVDAGSGVGHKLTGDDLQRFLAERRRIDKIRTTQL